MSNLNPAEPFADTVDSPRLRCLLRYWVEMAAGGTMPFRRQIDPVEIPSILPIALLADVTPSGARMRLLGSEATSAYGSETRDYLVEDIQLGEFTVAWQDAFSRVIQSARPAYAAGTYRRGTEPCRIETVLTPLTEDGSSVSQIFGGLLIRRIAHGSEIGQDRSGGHGTRAAGQTLTGQTADGADSRRADGRMV
jgi:hypothetical protein